MLYSYLYSWLPCVATVTQLTNNKENDGNTSSPYSTPRHFYSDMQAHTHIANY